MAWISLKISWKFSCSKVSIKLVNIDAGNGLFPDGTPDSKVHGANMGPIWGRQDPGGPHVGPMNFAIWDIATN